MREYSTYVPGVGLGYGSISYCKTVLEKGMSQSLARGAKRPTQQMKRRTNLRTGSRHGNAFDG